MGTLDKQYFIKLDTKLSTSNIIPEFFISDNDTSDMLIRITNENALVDLNNVIILMAATSPNNISYADFLEVKKAEEGIIYCNLKSQFKNIIGTWTARLMLVYENEKIVTNTFSYKVSTDDFVVLNEEIVTDDRFPLFTDLISRLSQIEIQENTRISNENTRIEAEGQREISKQQLIDLVNKLVSDTNSKVNSSLLENSNKIDKLINDAEIKIDNYKTEKDLAIDHNLEAYKINTTQDINTYKNNKDTEINQELEKYKSTTTADIEAYKNSKNTEINQYKTEKDLAIDNKLKEVDNAEIDRAKEFATYENTINTLKEDFNSAVSNVTNGNESATNTEIVLARKGEVSLKAKMDKVDEQFNTLASVGFSNGINDDVIINKLLLENNYVKGMTGQTYIISDTIVMPSNTTLDMSECIINWKDGVEGKKLVKNIGREAEITIIASINKGETTLTSSNHTFTTDDIGKTVCVNGAGGDKNVATILTADIVSFINENTVELSNVAKNTSLNIECRIHKRDKNIKVKGGVWNRGGAIGTTSKNLHGFDFRHVDNLEIDIESYVSTQIGAKYAILLGSVKYVTVSCKNLNTISDGLHINGPAKYIDVKYLGGKTGDDFISLTGADYPHYGDTTGDITDVHVGTIQIENALAGYKILAGAGNRIDNLVADFSTGTTDSYGCWIGDDRNYPDTTGGSYGYINLGEFFINSKTDMVRIVDAFVDSLELSPKGLGGTQLIHIMEQQGSVGGSINTLKLYNFSIPNNLKLITKEGLLSNINSIIIDNMNYVGNGVVIDARQGMLKNIIVQNSNINFTGMYPFDNKGCNIECLKLIDSTVDTTNSTGVGALIYRSGGVLNQIFLIRTELKSSGDKGFIAYSPKANSEFIITIDNSKINNYQRFAQYIQSDVTILLNNAFVKTKYAPITSSNELLNIKVIGNILKLETATKFFEDSTVGNIRVDGKTIPVRHTILTPSTGDVINNTYSVGSELGVVVWNGTSWVSIKNLV